MHWPRTNEILMRYLHTTHTQTLSDTKLGFSLDLQGFLPSTPAVQRNYLQSFEEVEVCIPLPHPTFHQGSDVNDLV